MPHLQVTIQIFRDIVGVTVDLGSTDGTHPSCLPMLLAYMLKECLSIKISFLAHRTCERASIYHSNNKGSLYISTYFLTSSGLILVLSMASAIKLLLNWHCSRCLLYWFKTKVAPHWHLWKVRSIRMSTYMIWKRGVALYFDQLPGLSQKILICNLNI